MSITFPCPATDFSGGRMIITSGYGPRWGSFHPGCDIGTTDGIETGVDLGAVEPGEIVFQQPAAAGAGAGHYTHLLGDSGTGWRYLHQLETFVLPPGTRVQRGQHIGEVGNTGGVAPHLHIEKLPGARGQQLGWWFAGHTVDPEPDLRDAMARGDYMNGATIPIPPPQIPPEDQMVTLDPNQAAQIATDAGKAAAHLLSGAARVQGDPNYNGLPDIGMVYDLQLRGEITDAVQFQVALNAQIAGLKAQGFGVAWNEGELVVTKP